MGKDKEEESIDQPKEEESEDQPESKESESEESEEETEEENSEESELVEVNGEKVSLDELKKGYMRTSDYTKKTTELAREKEKLMQAPKSNSGLAPEQQEVLNTLKGLGLTTRDELEMTVRRMLAQQQLMSEKERVQKDTELDDDMMYAAQALSLKKGITLAEAAKVLSGKKPIERKSLSAKGGVGKSVMKTGEKITPEYVASLNLKDPKDKKEFEKIQKAMEAGEL